VEEIIAISPAVLGILVIVVSIQVVGIVQFLKNFLPERFGKGYAVASLLVTAGCAAMNTSLVSPLATAIFDVTFLSLAVVQIAYQTVHDAIPTLFEKAITGFKTVGAKSGA
jgi:hypothetical protein